VNSSERICSAREESEHLNNKGGPLRCTARTLTPSDPLKKRGRVKPPLVSTHTPKKRRIKMYDFSHFYPDPRFRNQEAHDRSPIQNLKDSVRFYKAIIAEIERDKKKKDEGKKSTPLNVSVGTVAALLLWTWIPIGLLELYGMKMLLDTINHMVK
jgi:hypothetical protein